MYKRHVRAMAVLLAGVMVAGCATIMNQTTQAIGISSNPTGATVTVDSVPNGKTPVVARLSRKDNHIVKLELAGYKPYETTLTRRVSGWVWGNVAFGGLIGLAIDAITGGLYKLTPDQITGELRKEGQASLLRNDQLYVAVVMTPDPRWEKIGQLERTRSEERGVQGS